MKRYTLAAVAALLVFVPWHRTVRADAPLYTVQDLGSFGGVVPVITGINAAGQVVGNVMTPGSMAVMYTDGAGWHSLPGLDTGFSVAMGINASGDVVGYHFNTDGRYRAFRYRNGAVEDITPLPGGTMTQGWAINDAGDVTGYADTADNTIVAFVAAGPLPTQLPTLNGDMVIGCGINANGQVAGVADTPTWAQHGIRIDPGATSPIDIPSLYGADMSVNACAIDAAGHVGGQMQRDSNTFHAFRFTDGTGVIDLDTFGSSTSNVESIAAGVSAGWYTLADNSTHAFAHRDADGSFDLNTRINDPGWVLATAKAINESGVIAGEGVHNHVAAVYRLTPQQATDSMAPVINSVTANPSSIFPPSGQIVPVSLTVNATDDSGQAPVCSISSVAPSNGASVTGPLTGTVVAISGTTYTFTVTCVDAAQNTSAPAAATVVVMKDTTPPVIASVSATPNNLWPPDGRLVPVAVSVSASDDVDAVPVCALSNVGGGVLSDDVSIALPLGATLRATGGRTYSLTVACSDKAGNTSSKTTTVTVPPDVMAPTITALSATPGAIWPANNKFVAVTIGVSATDDVDASPVCTMTSVTGGPASDIVVTGPFGANVRAARNADGSVRTYTFDVSCADSAGNTSLAGVSVAVGKDSQAKFYHYDRRLRRFLEGLREAHGHDRDHDRR